MKRTIGSKWGDLKTGIIIVIAIAVLFWISLSGGGTSIFSKKQYFTCYFPTVTGLVKGSPVWLLGVDVGNVRSVKFVNLDTLRRVEVICVVKESVWDLLSDEATVSLGTIGFLGDKYIEVHPALGRGNALDEGDVISLRIRATPGHARWVEPAIARHAFRRRPRRPRNANPFGFPEHGLKVDAR